VKTSVSPFFAVDSVATGLLLALMFGSVKSHIRIW
jgi:hypothetical protein